MPTLTRSVSGALIAAIATLSPLLNAALSASAQDGLKPFDITIHAKQIQHFLPDEPAQQYFGKLKFIGGLELVSKHEHFGGYSDLRLLDADGTFLAVSDLGFWLSGSIQRQRGVLSGVENVVSAPILDASGSPLIGKSNGDAEGLEIIGNQAIISFERSHRVEVHEIDLKEFSGKVFSLGTEFRSLGLKGNKGLEAIVATPKTGFGHSANPNVRDWEFLTFSERSLNSEGDIRAFRYSQGNIEEFAVKRTNGFDITSADFGPDGDLFLLERRFTIATGVAMRIRRFRKQDIQPGATIDGEILINVKSEHQIDNMEGLTLRQNEAGKTVLLVVSDDNHFVLQRTLLLEFELVSSEAQ